MNNATYEELNLTQLNIDETYSTLRTPQTKIQPNNDLQRKADIDQSTGVKQSKTNEASNINTKFNTMLVTMMVIILLFTLTSIVLSVMIFSRLPSEQSKLVSQLNKNQSQILAQLDNQINRLTSEQYKLVSQLNEIEYIHITSVFNLTRLIMTQSNISQILAQLDKQINNIVPVQTHDIICPQIQSHCGAGLWWRVAYLNMTDPSQQCPSAWREYNTSGVKACGRPVTSTGSCATVSYLTNRQYSRVCGRIIGYQLASPDAFKRFNYKNRDLDGIIVSHGAEHDHIWSYVAGLTETGNGGNNCPCSAGGGTAPPTTIGDNYYCESGNQSATFMRDHLYFMDRLWDGQQCDHEGNCCTGNNSLPWFSAELPTPTTDVIEVSICCDQDTMDEDTPVEVMEIYVQ